MELAPGYRYSLRLLPPLMRIVLGVRSSFSRDAACLLEHYHPTPRVLNAHNVPTDSPFFVVINHYDRPGLAAWWGLAPILTTIAARRTHEPREVHLLMAREWHYARTFDHWVKQPAVRWFFGQFAKTYDCIGLPPALDLHEYRGQGATAIRRALALTRKNPPELLGASPEGNTGPNLALCQPPRGAGSMLVLLTHSTIPFLPVGIFEDDDRTINLNFGSRFNVNVPRRLSKTQRDCEAARQVMIEIGKLLPERMWGVYRQDIQNAFHSDTTR